MQKLISEKKQNCLSRLVERCDFYFSRKLDKIPEKPEFIILDVTHKCNLKCVMCEIYQNKESFSKDLKTEDIKEVIRQAKELGVREVIFSGGEALTRKDFFELLEYIRKIDYKCGILTNGVYSNAFFDRLSPYLISNHASITVSLDGINSETHDSIRGKKGTYKNVTELLSKLKNLKKRYPYVNYTAISVIMNLNLEELPKVAEYLKSMKVNEIQFQALIENNLVIKERKQKHHMWIPEVRMPVLDNTMSQLIDFKRKNPRLVANTQRDLELIKAYFLKKLNKEEIFCFQHYKSMLMSNDGQITTCFHSCGNVKDKKLAEIWQSEESINARNTVKNCKTPCLLPCFVDFRLNSLNSIFDEFIMDLNAEIKDKKTKKEVIREAYAILDTYENKLSGKNGINK